MDESIPLLLLPLPPPIWISDKNMYAWIFLLCKHVVYLPNGLLYRSDDGQAP